MKTIIATAALLLAGVDAGANNDLLLSAVCNAYDEESPDWD